MKILVEFDIPENPDNRTPAGLVGQVISIAPRGFADSEPSWRVVEPSLQAATEPAYTQESWRAKGDCVYFPFNAGGFSLRNCPDAEGNALRIAVCVNACKGISNKKLIQIACGTLPNEVENG